MPTNLSSAGTPVIKGPPDLVQYAAFLSKNAGVPQLFDVNSAQTKKYMRDRAVQIKKYAEDEGLRVEDLDEDEHPLPFVIRRRKGTHLPPIGAD